MLKGIIFDFDGVIAESVQVKIDAFAMLYNQYGPEIVKKVVEHHETNGGMSRFEKIKFYHESFLNKTIPEKEITDLANQFSDFVVEKIIAAPFVPGALEYIQKSYEQVKLFISTGTPTEEMQRILEKKNIAHYFTAVFGSPEKKTVHVNNIISKYKLSPDEMLFIGDSNSDMDAAFFHSVPFVLRLHTLNQNHLLHYTGQTIINFNNFNTEYFK
jgi:phosphoglycolate phosphatase-like HAD superfamily hydrolase|tara:strand:+ start:178 stop:819 length:642 start_codon:yes stop_codon:yes gene_type:complete